MPSLKATQAREIDKSTITEAETLAFEGRIISQTGKQTMESGEFYFRSTGIPITKYPNWFERLFWSKPQTTWKNDRHYRYGVPVLRFATHDHDSATYFATCPPHH